MQNLNPLDILGKNLDMLTDLSNSWEDVEGINLSNLDRFIKDFKKLIIEQTDIASTAQKLQTSLFDLSRRISKERKCDTREGRTLAFDVTCLAMGIFSSAKPDWKELSRDTLQLIFAENLEKIPQPQDSPKLITSGLENYKLVSKEWNHNAEIVKKKWFEQGRLSMKLIYGCKTGKEAIQCIIEKGLLSANLDDFWDITNADLDELMKKCPNLNQIILVTNTITDFSINKLKTLKILIIWSIDIKGTELLESLKTLSQLTNLTLLHCKHIQGDKLSETLQNLPQLTTLILFDLTIGDVLLETIKTLTKLTHLGFPFCKMIPWNEGIEAISELEELHPTRQITKISLEEVLICLSQLIELNLTGCNQIHNTTIYAWQKAYPKINFIFNLK